MNNELEKITSIAEEIVKQPARFSFKRVVGIIGLAVLFFASVFGSYYLFHWKNFRIAWADFSADRREHYLSCEELPFYPQVQKIFIKHQDAITQVKTIPGVVDFRAEERQCKIYDGGAQFVKGDMVLEYKTREARNKAEKILGKDFFGIPYRGNENN